MRPQGATLAEYMASMARVTFIMGPLGSGKTIQSCQKILKHMTMQEPDSRGVRRSRWYAVRNTYPDLTTTTIKDWMDLFGDLGRYKANGSEPPTHFLSFRLEDGSRVEAELVFLALDRPDSIKRLRGSQVTGFWLNEVKELSKAVVDMCDLRHGRYPRGDVDPTWHGMIGDTNAPDEGHWYHKLAEEVQPEGWVFLRQPGGVIRDGLDGSGRVRWRPNPNAENLANLPDGYYVRGMEGKGDDWIAVNLANEYGAVHDGKPVYPEFNEFLHVANAPLAPYKGLPLILGWDFGLTPACVIGQVSPRGQLRVYDELIADGMGIRQFARTIVVPHLMNHYSGFKYESVGDPAGNTRVDTNEKTCLLELREADIPTEPAVTNEFTARREAVAGFLTRLVDGEPAFLLSPGCRVLRSGFKGGYCYRKMQVPGEDRYTEVPDKNMYSHPHDGLQYLALKAAGPVRKHRRRVVRRTRGPAYNV